MPGAGVHSGLATQLLTVYGCVTRVADVMATMPVDHYTRFGGIQQPMGQRAPFLVQPNPEVSWASFVKQYVWSRLIDGNSFIVPIRSAAGRVVELYALDPSTVQLRRDRPGGPVTPYINGVPFLGEMWHIPAYLLPGAVRGINPIENARVALSVGLHAQEYGAGFFNNSGVPALVIRAKGAVTQPQVEEIRDNWNGAHRGKSGGVGVLGGDAEVTKLTISPEEAQFLETQRFSSAQIAANMFKVPPYLAGVAVDGSSLTYQNISDLFDDLVRSACMPLMKDLEDVVSLRALPQPQFIKLNADVWLRPATKTRYETHKIGIDAGFLLDDEARALEDLPPLTAEQRAQVLAMRKPATAAPAAP
jgi:HK97 family phage portal protein